MKDAMHGFCMALADSVPGVSGGTIAFIMGFYDRFITALNQIVFGKWKEKKKAGRYLVRLGAGWIMGMIAISAMFLPGISGSTLLLIFGVYIPVITAVKKLLSLQLEYLPAVFFFGCGVLAGAVTVVKAIITRRIFLAELQWESQPDIWQFAFFDGLDIRFQKKSLLKWHKGF